MAIKDLIMQQYAAEVVPATTIDDLFSVTNYIGSGAAKVVSTGIDISTGGLIVVKARNNISNFGFVDSIRGVTKVLSPAVSTAETTDVNSITAISSTGFTLGSSATYNTSGKFYSAFSFKKSPSFFDVVTYTGTGTSSLTVPHNLGSAPGMVTVKAKSATGNWATRHESSTGLLYLNRTDGAAVGFTEITASSSTTFTVDLTLNASGVIYIAYIFASDPSIDGNIACGSFTTDVSSNATVSSLSWEPQLVLCKRLNSQSDWFILNSTSGLTVSNSLSLAVNSTAAETVITWINPTTTGFNIKNLFTSSTYVYIAIRRPYAAPTTGSSVFYAKTYTGNGATQAISGVGFSPDLTFVRPRTTVTAWSVIDSMRGYAKSLISSTTAAETVDTSKITGYDNSDGFSISTSASVNSNGITYVAHNFKRATGFFTIAADTGTGVNKTVPHNLGAVPELMIRKSRSSATDWIVWSKSLAAAECLVFNTTAAKATAATYWNSTAPTDTVFSVGNSSNINLNLGQYVTYLFATVSGVSKVGSYTGNGTTQTINCGFSTGARFILIKCTSSVGDWFTWDTSRGIIAGSDPFLAYNTTTVENTADDSIDPDSTGFIVNQTTSNINANTATYIYLAIA